MCIIGEIKLIPSTLEPAAPETAAQPPKWDDQDLWNPQPFFFMEGMETIGGKTMR